MFLSLNLDFDLVIYIDEAFLLVISTYRFYLVSWIFNFVIYIDEAFTLLI